MDTEAVLRRRPQVCVVDEFPHTNVPGSERTKRWEDVEVLIEAGIDVLTTMNIQHLESLNDQVWQITGIRVRETIPDWVMQRADQVVMVDLTPRALLNRLARGVVYPAEKAKKALEHFFQESTLVALRELALRQTAHEVEIRQVDYDSPGFQEAPPNGDETGVPPRSVDRILILATPDPSTAMLIRRGKRVADYLHADCFAVAVSPHNDLRDLPTGEREALERHLNFARNLHIEARLLQGENAANTLVEFARLNGITHLFVARPGERQKQNLFGRTLVQEIVHLARDMQVMIVADRSSRPHSQ
jgi:two-component system, OmpR family, sensor histidine kinase KdpD